MNFLNRKTMCDFVGMPNKITCVDRTENVEWPSPIRVGVPRWDAVHSHLVLANRQKSIRKEKQGGFHTSNRGV